MSTASNTIASNPNDLYVVTENGEQCFMWRANQLTYIAQDRHELPSVLAAKFGPLATKLDLSYNQLTSFRNINAFVQLNELILDNNCLEDEQLEFRQNLRLKTLSLNKNKLKNLHKLVSSIKFCFPNLEYLSLIGNPLCPMANGCHHLASTTTTTTTSTDGTTTAEQTQLISTESILYQAPPVAEDAGLNYQKYRHFIIYHLPNLHFLDSRPVSGRERDEALRRCYWMTTTGSNNGPNNNNNNSNHHTNNGPVLVWQGRQQQQQQQPLGAQYSSVALVERAIELDPSATNNRQGDASHFQLTIMSDDQDETATGGQDPSQPQLQQLQQQQPKGIFSRLTYRYTGRNSEGNRFIRNQDL